MQNIFAAFPIFFYTLHIKSLFQICLVCKDSELVTIPRTGFHIIPPCSKTEITKISVWNFISNENNTGKWFDVTKNVRDEFPVDNESIVSKY